MALPGPRLLAAGCWQWKPAHRGGSRTVGQRERKAEISSPRPFLRSPHQNRTPRYAPALLADSPSRSVRRQPMTPVNSHPTTPTRALGETATPSTPSSAWSAIVRRLGFHLGDFQIPISPNNSNLSQAHSLILCCGIFNLLIIRFFLSKL